MKHTKQFLQKNFIFTIFLSFSLCNTSSAITSLIGRNAEGYLGPIGTMLGSDMNSGYFRKTTPHKILGFDLTLDFAYALPPKINLLIFSKYLMTV